MNREAFTQEKHYQLALFIARSMLVNGVITAEELAEIDTILRRKYDPLLGSIYPL